MSTTNESAKKAQVQTKANEIIFSDMLKNLDKSLFVTNKGTNKENLYKSEIFKDCTDKEKKAIRRKIRNVRESFIYSFLRITNKNQLDLLFVEFSKFVKSTYNFEFKKENLKIENFCSSNTNETEKQNIKKALLIIEKLF